MDYKTTISDIFSPRKNTFAVPNYQRAYSWEVGADEDKQIPQFLTDLKDHPINVPQYHLGHFLFEQDKTDRNKFWIIDGQQRMTTAVIFMSCIYSRLKSDPKMEKETANIYSEYLLNTDGKQKFETVNYDNNFFINNIIDSRSDTVDTKSRKRIIQAKKYFSKEIEKVDTQTILHWKQLIENSKITTDTVEDKAEATQIFTFQNDRGKDLTDLEKLKAYLMLQIYLSCKTSESNPNVAINYIEKEFESIYRSLEKIKIANENQILSYHTTAFLALAGTAMDRIKNAFNKQIETSRQKWIKDFAVNLKESFEHTLQIQKKRDELSYIADILYLDSPNSFPLLLKIYHFQISATERETLLRFVEIILFKLKYTTGNYYTNYLPNRALDFKGNIQDLKNALLHDAKNGFKNYWNFEGDFINYLEGDNHYFGLSRYLLWKYENKLREDVREPAMLYPEFANLYGSAKFENTIDHWTPQNPYEVEYEPEFNKKYLHNIGNMVLSTRGRNSSDSNNLPSNRSTNSVLISRQILEPHKIRWGKDEIKNRQNEIARFALSYWNPDRQH
ncbi:DUF262 domain-containing protein [Owenweeksia hongkongensis]|uniref:DUF262 domain-containing protein n=1 Tax=Owenweeksia hongkongensis TaxID=253245 RepID=UPI003A90252E